MRALTVDMHWSAPKGACFGVDTRAHTWSVRTVPTEEHVTCIRCACALACTSTRVCRVHLHPCVHTCARLRTAPSLCLCPRGPLEGCPHSPAHPPSVPFLGSCLGIGVSAPVGCDGLVGGMGTSEDLKEGDLGEIGWVGTGLNKRKVPRMRGIKAGLIWAVPLPLPTFLKAPPA